MEFEGEYLLQDEEISDVATQLKNKMAARKRNVKSTNDFTIRLVLNNDLTFKDEIFKEMKKLFIFTSYVFVTCGVASYFFRM